MEAVVILANVEPLEWGAIAVGAVLIAGFIFWRIRMGRKPKEAHERLDTAP
jgi:hypothetical protein